MFVGLELDFSTANRQSEQERWLRKTKGPKLTSQLLAFSRRQRLAPKPFDVNQSLENMHHLLQSTLGGGISIVTQFRPEIWPALADPAQIELVVLNLAINARDAMDNRGTLTIETSDARVGPPEKPEEPVAGDYVMIAVSDTPLDDRVCQKRTSGCSDGRLALDRA